MSLKPLLTKPLFLAVTTTCPFCNNAIRLASSKGIKPEVINLDQRTDGADLRKQLTELTKQKTVPYVFSEGNFIGGFTDLAKKPESFWTGLPKAQQ